MQPIHLVQAKLQQHVEAAKSYHSSETNEWHFAIRLRHNQQVCIGKGPEESTALIEAEHRAIAYLRGAGIWKDEQQDALFCFSVALAQLKAGKRIARQGWNGKGMYVVAQAHTTTTDADKIWNAHNKAHAEKLGGKIDVAPYCTLKTAQDTLAMGWIPSTGDLFAEDWMIL